MNVFYARERGCTPCRRQPCGQAGLRPGAGENLPCSQAPKHPSSQAQAGQAMVETALFSVLAVILAFGMLSWIPLHRARTQATAAAYSCAQFISQSPNPSLAAQNALLAVEKTLDADWSATLGVTYKVIVSPGSPGGPGGCSVSYQVPVMFKGLGLIDPGGWSEEWYVSRSETWKAKWR